MERLLLNILSRQKKELEFIECHAFNIHDLIHTVSTSTILNKLDNIPILQVRKPRLGKIRWFALAMLPGP